MLASNEFLMAWLPIIVFLALACGLSVIMIGTSWLVGVKRPDVDKLAPYECGFDAFEDARDKFDVRFYLVAILFTLFDLEVAFLFPWAVTLGRIGWFGYVSAMIFLGILTIGFIYEWKKGALDWE